MSTVIVWFRNDLRVHDHPALAKAAESADHVVPVFIFDPSIVKGRHRGSNRNRFLLECLVDLRHGLRERGADLVVRSGDPTEVLAELARQTGADALYYTADYSPLALRRDKSVEMTLTEKVSGLEVRGFPGRLIVSGLDKITTKSGSWHKAFTPFWRVWSDVGRRDIAKTPRSLALPDGMHAGDIPSVADMTDAVDLSSNVIKGGETEARRRLQRFLDGDIEDYHISNNDMGKDGTSRLSAYFHFGCLSPLEVESMLPDGEGARAWHRQLAWREFYHYILYHNPSNSRYEFQDKYRALKWNNDTEHLTAWQQGRTGYPAVDAAMRQLNTEGWMHNRARLIVGSFLVKDLWLDWRLGEGYFMRMLIDGDQANNNGNWQWIASVGVDPAPVYRRLYNPSSQRDKYDPDGAYVRRYVPELKNVPDKYLSEPWTMPDDVQEQAGCIIGKDYPAPIVSHKEAREAALEHYRAVG